MYFLYLWGKLCDIESLMGGVENWMEVSIFYE